MAAWIGRREFLAGSAALLALSRQARASNHRNSPSIDSDVAIDITDVYMFRSPSDPSKLVMVLNTHPFSIAVEANTYHYEPSAVYRFNFTTNAAAIPTSHIDLVVTPFANGAQNFTAFFPDGTVVQGPVTQGTVTSNTPNPPMITQGPAGSGITIFAGPRDDPFFFDIVGFNRLLAGTGGFTGRDSFAGFNVMSIVVEFPIALVTNGVSRFGAWAVTYYDQTRLGDFNPERPPRRPLGKNLMQIDRAANPFVDAALIPAPLKNAYNYSEPRNDARDFEPAILQTLAGFKTSPADTQTILSVIVPDTMKLDLSQPDGYPNGRRLEDNVGNIILSLVFNQPTDTGVEANDVPFLEDFPFLAPPHQVKRRA